MQEADIDTLKFCVSLINKLKKQEVIDVNNKLIKAGLESIRNDALKVLI
jgi:aryl carrier-like protein